MVHPKILLSESSRGRYERDVAAKLIFIKQKFRNLSWFDIPKTDYCSQITPVSYFFFVCSLFIQMTSCRSSILQQEVSFSLSVFGILSNISNDWNPFLSSFGRTSERKDIQNIQNPTDTKLSIIQKYPCNVQASLSPALHHHRGSLFAIWTTVFCASRYRLAA